MMTKTREKAYHLESAEGGEKSPGNWKPTFLQ